MNRVLANLRWWHVVGLVLAPIGLLLLPVAVLAVSGFLNRVWLVAVIPAVSPAIWWLIFSPWLDAGDVRFSETVPPRRRLRILLIVAWGPMLFAGLFLGAVVLEWVVNWWWTGRTDVDWAYLWWPSAAIPPTAAYGYLFSRALRRRLQNTVRLANVCFDCAYDLTGLDGGERCPECGASRVHSDA